MAQTIDLTPTWLQVLPILLEVFKHGESTEGRKTAMTELRRIAEIADEYVKLEKSGILNDNILHIAQIQGQYLSSKLICYLRKGSTFKDTDKDLNEFIVPMSVVNDAIVYFSRWKDKNVYNHISNIYEKYKNCSYLHVTFI